MGLDESDLEARLEQMAERLHEKMLQRASGAAPSLLSAAETVGDIFAKYSEQVASRRTENGCRISLNRNFDVWAPLILDLPFVHEDKRMTFRHLPGSELTSEMVESWRQQLIQTPKGSGRRSRPRQRIVDPNREEQGYADASINRAVAVFQTVVRWRVGGKKKQSPIRGICRQNVDDAGRKGYFKDEDELKYFLSCCHPTLADMASVSVTAGGMRKSEVRLLTVDQVTDWDEGTITLKGKVAQRSGTKNRKDRTFPILPETLEMLKRRRAIVEALPPCDCNAMVKPGPHWHLFYCPRTSGAPGSTAGGLRLGAVPVSDSAMADWMRQAQRRSGIRINGEKPVFHHFRHTWATWGLALGVDLPTLMREGGWSTPRMAMAYAKQADTILAKSRQIRQKSMKELRAGGERKPAKRTPEPISVEPPTPAYAAK